MHRFEEVRQDEDQKRNMAIGCGVLLMAALALLVVMVASVERVEAGHECVVRHSGKAVGTIGPGWHWMNPFAVPSVKCYDMRELSLEYTGGETNARFTDSVISQQSSDGRDVNVAALVKFQLDGDQLEMIHNTKAKNLDGLVNLIKPVIRNEVREVIDGLPIEEIYPGGLGRVSNESKVQVTEALKPYGVTVVEFNLTRIDPDDEYEAAITSQQQAKEDQQLAIVQQEAAKEQAEKNRIVAEGEANAKIEAANGEAEAKRVQADADAYVTTTNAKAEAQANTEIAASLTPELVQMAYYEALKSANWAIFNVDDVAPIVEVPTVEPAEESE